MVINSNFRTRSDLKMQVPVTKEILEIVRNYAHQHDISLSEFGRRTGISKAWLSKLKNHDANLSLETATYILKACGYKLEIKKGGSATAVEDLGKVVEAKPKKISRLKKVVECQKQ
jgi:transcriptional regulator with XRE-family HTH domain